MATPHQIFFLSHGGGPMPILGDPGHWEMVASLQKAASLLRKPDAILVISAHWEETLPTVTSAQWPSLIYDYYGFPDESYEIQYQCPGHPQLADEILQGLQGAGIEAGVSSSRGLDHGVFIPLKIMYPNADIPCVQLSLCSSLDPKAHIAIGQALANVATENLLVIGSGFSFHNMKAFFTPDTEESTKLNTSFEQWLIETCTQTTISEGERQQRLIQWEQAPGARFCHPREEHLLPLHVCVGMANRAADQYLDVTILNKQSSMYLWV